MLRKMEPQPTQVRGHNDEWLGSFPTECGTKFLVLDPPKDMPGAWPTVHKDGERTIICWQDKQPEMVCCRCILAMQLVKPAGSPAEPWQCTAEKPNRVIGMTLDTGARPDWCPLIPRADQSCAPSVASTVPAPPVHWLDPGNQHRNCKLEAPEPVPCPDCAKRNEVMVRLVGLVKEYMARRKVVEDFEQQLGYAIADAMILAERHAKKGGK